MNNIDLRPQILDELKKAEAVLKKALRHEALKPPQADAGAKPVDSAKRLELVRLLVKARGCVNEALAVDGRLDLLPAELVAELEQAARICDTARETILCSDPGVVRAIAEERTERRLERRPWESATILAGGVGNEDRDEPWFPFEDEAAFDMGDELPSLEDLAPEVPFNGPEDDDGHSGERWSS